MLLTNLLFFAIACAVLAASSVFIVKSLTKISHFLRLSEYVTAFILMAIATTLPELFVGITSALAKNPALSLGNVIGSNIADIAFVGSIAVLLAHGIKARKEIRVDSLFLLPVAAIPLVLFFIGHGLSRLDGVILLIAFGVYSSYLLRKRKVSHKLEDGVHKWEPIAYSFVFIFSGVIMFFSARYLVKYASLISVDLQLPPLLVGLFFIAIGTSLPELAFSSAAALSRHGEMALGDISGAVMANSTLVLGVTALIYPISANFMFFLISSAFMIIIIFLFATFIGSGSKISIMEGIALLLMYMFFIIVEFYVRGAMPFVT